MPGMAMNFMRLEDWRESLGILLVFIKTYCFL
jgi:hypothetical protein